MSHTDQPRQPAARLPQFEFLRVCCMLGIVVNHFFTYGLDIYGLHAEPFQVPVHSVGSALLWGILEAVKLLSLVSVNCFVLISGYFLTHHTAFRLSGIRRVWLQTCFYGATISLLLSAFGLVPFSALRFAEYFLPVCTNQYWFVTTYLALMLLAPFLARLSAVLDRRSYGLLLSLGFVLCLQYPLGRMFVDEQQLALFVFLFMAGGYFRRFGGELHFGRRLCLGAAAACFGAMFAIALVKNILAGEEGFRIYAMAYHSLVLPLSVIVFAAVVRWRCPEWLSRMLPGVSPYVLAVYLIHSHPQLQDMLWSVVGRHALSRPLFVLPFFCLFSSMAIFAVSILIDYGRAWLWRMCARMF